MKKTDFRLPWRIIGSAIYRNRLRQGLTQEKLAARWCRELRALGLPAHMPSATLISMRENGRTPSTLGELAAFERALGLDEAALTGLLIDGEESTAEVNVLLRRLDPAQRTVVLEMLRCVSRLAEAPDPTPLSALDSA
jgi:transcriptional regulator with XRE-family HTH domain